MSPRGRLIIVCGLPGSGKTTVARSIEEELGAIRLSPDDWMDALRMNLHLRYVSAPSKVLIERIQRRARESPPIHEDAIQQWLNIFEVPTEEEFALYDSPLEAEPDFDSK